MEKKPVIKGIFKERFKVSEERLDHCRKCDRFESGPNRCKECGCFMDYKTLLPWATCPLGKWGVYSGEQQKENDDV